MLELRSWLKKCVKTPGVLKKYKKTRNYETIKIQQKTAHFYFVKNVAVRLHRDMISVPRREQFSF